MTIPFTRLLLIYWIKRRWGANIRWELVLESDCRTKTSTVGNTIKKMH